MNVGELSTEEMVFIADMIRVAPDKAARTCLLNPYAGDHRDKLALAREYKLKPAQVFETRREGWERSAREEAAKEVFETEDKRQEWVAEKVKEKENAKKKDDQKIFNWMKREKFGKVQGDEFVTEGGKPKPVEPKKTQGDGSLLRAFRWGMGVERNEEIPDAIPFALRYEGRQYGFTFLPPIIRYPVPKIGGYLLPKMTFMFPNTRQGAIPGRKLDRPYRFSLEALYTPSAARTFDWYVASGSEWSRPVAGFGYEARLVNEGGLRFRFNGGDFGIPLLIGGRVGMRITGFAEARQPRLIFELGTGAF